MNVIVDYRASKDTIDALLKLKLNVIKTPVLSSVYDAISGHADIMFHKITDNEAVCEPNVYDYFKRNLPKCQILKGRTCLKEKYPGDIAYNVCRISDKIFCNKQNADRQILDRYESMGYSIIDVKQGYTKCSICVVSDNAIITSDRGICRVAEKNGIDVLQIDDNDIRLPGLSNGFFGGATGLIEKNKLAVNGNIERHRDHKSIIDFCRSYDVDVISLNNDEIVDIGSIILI